MNLQFCNSENEKRISEFCAFRPAAMSGALDDAFAGAGPGPDETAHMTNDEIRQRAKMIDNEIRIMRSEYGRARARARARGARAARTLTECRAAAVPPLRARAQH